MIVYIDMDDTICDYSSAHARALISTPGILFPQSQYGFYEKLIPLPKAVESVKKLILSPEYEPYILTAPSTRNPMSYTEKRMWVEKHFGLEFTEKLIICANKGLLKGHILIDDCVEGRGQEYFDGTLIQFGSYDYPNWKSIIAALM